MIEIEKKNDYKSKYNPSNRPTEEAQDISPTGNQFFQEEFDSGQFMREIINPDLKNDEKFRQFLTKELKVSNIQPKDLREVVDLTDLAFQAKSIKAEGFSDFLLLLREVKLSASSSLKGFERAMETSVINVQKIDTNEKGKLKDKLLGRS
ncbi:MAG: hypothetical protein U9Q97_03745 [Acidobacteriota bacterium]|nr:hypothetical protein [Acidobacteriota bacterium]